MGRALSAHRLGEELGELAHLAGDCAGLLMVPLSSGGEFLSARFVEAGVQLRRPMGLGTVSSDRIRLQEVLVNLISNGIKYAAAEPPRSTSRSNGAGCPSAKPTSHALAGQLPKEGYVGI